MISNNNLKLPNLFLLGVPKAGTTTLFDMLSRHPEIYPSKIKETQFLISDEFGPENTNEYLRKYCSGSGDYQYVGEGTPRTFNSPLLAIQRIKNIYGEKKGNLKFIVIFRDPIDRAHSNYLHRLRNGTETKSFSDAVETQLLQKTTDNLVDDFSNYIAGSLYSQSLQQWLSAFERHSFLFLDYSLLKKKDGNDIAGACWDFLKLENFSTSLKTLNSQGMVKSNLLMKILNGSVPAVTKNIWRMIPEVRRKELKRKIRRLNISKPIDSNYTAIEKEVYQRLSNYYKEDVQTLRLLTGLELDGWLSQN